MNSSGFDWHLALNFAVALACGVLLGLEREHSHLNKNQSGDSKGKSSRSIFAGARTVGLVSMLGAISGYVYQTLQAPWFMVMVFAALVLLLVVSYASSALKGSLGMTSEVAVILAFILGAMCMWGWMHVAVAICIISLLLLSIKPFTSNLAAKIQPADIEATLKFAIITAIILPLLPNHNYGIEPFNVVNPYKIWLMVVLISGLNFASYLLIKVVGTEHGIGLTGFLGGLVSSTAVTLGFSQRSKTTNDSPAALSQGILLSWTVMFFRIMILVTLLNTALGQRVCLALGVLAVLSLLICLWLWWHSRSSNKANVSAGSNPFELMQAIKFGLLFGVVLLIAKAAQVYFGDSGLYAAATVAGLTDVDAISLSMVDLANKENAMLEQAAIAIVIAVAANTAFKTGIVYTTGSKALKKEFMPWAGLLLLTCVAMLIYMYSTI